MSGNDRQYYEDEIVELTKNVACVFADAQATVADISEVIRRLPDYLVVRYSESSESA